MGGQHFWIQQLEQLILQDFDVTTTAVLVRKKSLISGKIEISLTNSELLDSCTRTTILSPIKFTTGSAAKITLVSTGVNCQYLTGRDFPGGSLVKNLPANARNMGSIPGAGRRCMPGAARLVYRD